MQSAAGTSEAGVSRAATSPTAGKRGFAASGSTWRTACTASAASLAILLAGCGNTYRPVVSAINPVGPASQPTKYAVAVSNPGTGLAGLLTIVDFSGDTTLSTPSILPNPSYFTLNPGGTTGYVVNTSGALDTFAVSNPTGLRTNDIGQTTLLAGANPVNISALAGSQGTVIYISQTGRQSVAALGSAGPSLLQELSVGAANTPVYVVGNDNSPRVYALSSAAGGANGLASAIETTTSLPTISAQIPVGNNPVYGVTSTDLTRAFILNKGSGTVSVINVPTNALDATTPTIPATGTLGVNPIWAEYVPTLSELVVLNAGNGATPGTLSIISVPQCNSVTVNTTPTSGCNPLNPADAQGFGSVIATVPVGLNPVMVSALRDGSRAYVANAANVSSVCAGQGSVSVINLSTNTVSSTLCGVPNVTDPNASPTNIYGHPNSIAVTLASPTGKVYVTSGDSNYMTVIRTDTDAVSAHVNLQGTGLRVMMTAP